MIWLAFFMRRTVFLVSLLSLRKVEGIELKIAFLPALILPRTLKKPLIEIKVREKIYDVYLYHGGGKWRYVHIANERYSVVFSKLGGMASRGVSRTLGTSKRVAINLPGGVGRAKVRTLPKPKGNGHVPLLVFSPEPAELTYVTKERTSIRVAFTGERIGLWQIFTRDTLINYLDRDSRGFYD